MPLLFLLIANPAVACEWWWWIEDFDSTIDQATEVPLDGVVVARINHTAVRFEVSPEDGGPVSGTVDYFHSPMQEMAQVGFTPDLPFEPNTAYTVELFIDGYTDQYDPNDPVVSTAFTTGTELSPIPQAPSLSSASANAWAEDLDGRWYCTIGSPVHFRTVELEVDVPESPAWSWLVIRATDGKKRDLLHIEPLDGVGGTMLVSYDQTDSQPGDCLTASLMMANGEEAVSNEVCIEPIDADGGSGGAGCGCEFSTRGNGLSWLVLASLLLRRRRVQAP